MRCFFYKTLATILAVYLSFMASAQDPISLSIGDAAPPIKYSKWLKGTPVNSYKGERLYVLEFWATWCGPCIAAMPHLSELSKKYQDKATFIGVNVWENTDNKPYESCLPEVTRFVNSSANRMSYDVIVDNNAKDMVNSWLTPAGVNGIPTTFVVKEGKIVWIGHPIKLDSILDPIIAGAFDVAAFKKDYEARSAASLKQINEVRTMGKEIKEAADAKNFKKAFQLVDEAVQKMPVFSFSFKAQKFGILLDNFPETEALNFAKELTKENRSFATYIGMTIADNDGYSKELYLFAAKNLKDALEKNNFSGIYDKMALAYNKAGEMQMAVEAQEKAVAAAKKEVKDQKFEGRVFDYTITAYQETLAKYKKDLKN